MWHETKEEAIKELEAQLDLEQTVPITMREIGEIEKLKAENTRLTRLLSESNPRYLLGLEREFEDLTQRYQRVLKQNEKRREDITLLQIQVAHARGEIDRLTERLRDCNNAYDNLVLVRQVEEFNNLREEERNLWLVEHEQNPPLMEILREHHVEFFNNYVSINSYDNEEV